MAPLKLGNVLSLVKEIKKGSGAADSNTAKEASTDSANKAGSEASKERSPRLEDEGAKDLAKKKHMIVLRKDKTADVAAGKKVDEVPLEKTKEKSAPNKHTGGNMYKTSSVPCKEAKEYSNSDV